ncbi:MAG: DUF4125 family protein [Bacillota bacterium]
MTDNRELINRILEIELNMFLNVPTYRPVACRESPEGFKLVRGSSFAAWSREALESYLNDLSAAVQKGINLMTQKYARMDNLIPPINTNPLIDNIVEIEEQWQAEVRKKYPCIVGSQSAGQAAGPSNFARYLRTELETYSDETLRCYYENLNAALGKGENLSEKIYGMIYRGLGYSSLEEANSALHE